MHNKTKISIAMNVILSIALVLVGLNGINHNDNVKKLEEKVKNNDSINAMLEAEISNLEIDNMKLEEALEIANGDVDKLKELQQTIKNDKATIDKLETEIATLKKDISQKNTRIKELESSKGNVEELNKEISILKDAIRKQEIMMIELEDELLEITLISEGNYATFVAIIVRLEEIVEDINSKIDANKDNEEIVNILNEIRYDLGQIITNT